MWTGGSAARIGFSRLTGGNALFNTARAGDGDVHSLLQVFEALLGDLYPVVDTSFLQRLSRRKEFTSSHKEISITSQLMQTNTMNLKIVEKKNTAKELKREFGDIPCVGDQRRYSWCSEIN